MIRLLQPRLLISSVFDLNLDDLKDSGYQGLIMDLDNTLVAWNRPEVPKSLTLWLGEVRQRGIEMCIVSNNLSQRVEEFSAKIGVSFIAKAAKPRRRAFRQAMRAMGTQAYNTAVVGDQVFTDILGGNRLQLYTILVHPLATEEFWTTRLIRKLEKQVVRRHFTQG